MRRLIALVARLYPRSWRAEFGDEFDAFLCDVRPRWRVLANVLGGAVAMQITEGTGWLKIVGLMALAGAIVGGGASFRVSPRYESSAVISVTPQPDPVRPTSPEVLRERVAIHVKDMEAQMLSRWSLSTIIQDPTLRLYQDDLRRMPLQDVSEKMRHDIRIQARPSTDASLSPIVFSISFSYPDQVKAQAVVRELATRFTEVNVVDNKARTDVYRDVWRVVSDYDHTKTALPPPPVGDVVSVLNSASLPAKSGPDRAPFGAWGLGAGLLLGVVMRWPRGASQLAAFGLAGFLFASAASFLIPNRFTSTAVMEVEGPMITEDPLAPLRAATPAAEFLRQVEPELLSMQRLSRIITDPRNNLYPEERANKPTEEVARDMLANDLRIAPLSPGSAAFSVSFSYSDRYKAQRAVQSLMSQVDELNQNRQKATADASGSFILRTIIQRKAGEVLDIVDVASLPTSPVGPNRLVIAAMGLVAGLLAGGIRLWLRRSRTPGAGAGENAYAT